MTDWKIPLYKIYSDDEDLNLITKVIKRGNNWALGPEIEEFEKALANFVDVDYCVAVNSGTSALHATLLSYGLKTDDEVIIPSFSFISTANSVLFVGSKPIFSDIEEATFGLDPQLIESSINQKTRAIMPMDYGGMSCNIFEIKQITAKHNLILIEDAAEGLGAKIKGKQVGSQSDSAIFSFCGNKVLTTGEGGAIVTNSKKVSEKLKLIRSHGRLDRINYFENSLEPEYVGLGYNWRMSSMTAALGISQLKKLDKLISMRQKNAEKISSHLSKYPEIKLPFPPSEYEHIYQMYTIRLQNKKMRDLLKEFLADKKIFSKVYFNPIHLSDFYKEKLGKVIKPLPITEKISQEVLTLPLYPNMTNEEMNYLLDSIGEFFESQS